MQALKDAGWHAVTLDQLQAYWTPRRAARAGQADRAHLRQRLPLPVHGGAAGAQAARLGRRREHPAQRAAAVAGRADRRRSRALVAAGWELDTQGISHADLDRARPAELQHQVADARHTIQRRYDVPVNWFCYPSGHYDATVIDEVKRAGLRRLDDRRPRLGEPAETPTRCRGCGCSAAPGRPRCSARSPRRRPAPPRPPELVSA